MREVTGQPTPRWPHYCLVPGLRPATFCLEVAERGRDLLRFKEIQQFSLENSWGTEIITIEYQNVNSPPPSDGTWAHHWLRPVSRNFTSKKVDKAIRHCDANRQKLGRHVQWLSQSFPGKRMPPSGSCLKKLFEVGLVKVRS